MFDGDFDRLVTCTGWNMTASGFRLGLQMGEGAEGRELVIHASPYSHAETVRRLVEQIHGRGIELFAQIDHAANASRVGLEMPGATVLVFGDPAVGTPVMVRAPDFALELPSRVLVRTQPDGSVVVVHHDVARLAAGYGLDHVTVQPLVGLSRLIDAALEGPV